MRPFKRKEVTLEDIFAYLNQTPTGRDVVTYLTDPAQNITIEQERLGSQEGGYATYDNIIVINSDMPLHDQALVLAHEATHIGQFNDPAHKWAAESLKIRGSYLKYALIDNNDMMHNEAEADNTVNMILHERKKQGLKNEIGMVFFQSTMLHGIQRSIIGGLAKTFYAVRNRDFLKSIETKESREFFVDSARQRALFGYEKFVKQTGLMEALSWRCVV